eukprot:CAMPEP_0115888486 /NCGR_PEP_ID=MMETSP0287-20121206/32331_1 /TAXON_ID=412157 /ORGANISM="Chrysochromulina rotalis, Strain UIO044" /LENGTH=157 /DNA_ID=CAMNT_0003345169 /DNA_START=36 /DNA_END=509 /DNA_ORIENTATION=-
MTYCDVYMVSSDVLTRVLQAFPVSAALVRRSTVLLAFRRHVIDVARKEKLAREGEQRRANGDFLDRTHESDLSYKEQTRSVNMAVELQSKNSIGKRRGEALVGTTREPSDEDPAADLAFAHQEMQKDMQEIRAEMKALRQIVEKLAVTVTDANTRRL